MLLPRPTSVKTKQSSSSKTKASKVWHLRLLKPYTAVEGEEGGEEEREEERGCSGESVVFEVPIEMQGYRIIDRSGPQGINNAVSQITW